MNPRKICDGAYYTGFKFAYNIVTDKLIVSLLETIYNVKYFLNAAEAKAAAKPHVLTGAWQHKMQEIPWIN